MLTINLRDQLVELPELPGITFRGFQGEADYANILAVIESCRVADQLERADTLEDIIRTYSHLVNCDPYQDMVFAESNGQVLGYCRAWWAIDGEGKFMGFQLGFVNPTWRRHGIGSAFLSFCENRHRAVAKQLIAEGKLPPDAPRLHDGFIQETEVDRAKLFDRRGYQGIRYAFNMVRPDLESIPEAPLPAGLIVRQPNPEEYRQVWEASNDAFQDHWGYIPDPWEDFQGYIESPIFDPSLWKVAWDGDQIAGMVLSFIDKAENEEFHRRRGYTENICVRRPYRRQGLARALIAQSLHELKQRGMDHAALGVDAENLTGALHLYESMGYQVVKRTTIYRKAF